MVYSNGRTGEYMTEGMLAIKSTGEAHSRTLRAKLSKDIGRMGSLANIMKALKILTDILQYDIISVHFTFIS